MNRELLALIATDLVRRRRQEILIRAAEASAAGAGSRQRFMETLSDRDLELLLSDAQASLTSAGAVRANGG